MYVMCVCIRVYVYVSLCVQLRVAVVMDSFMQSELGNGRSELRVCCGPDARKIRRLIYRMIRRSVPVRTVKTRQRFGCKTVSFHVSVCSFIISLFIVVSIIYMLLVSFHVTDCYILSA